MKNCNEMVNSLFERREQYITEQKRKRKVFTRTVTSVCCICFVAILGFGMWESGWLSTNPSVPLKDSTVIGENDYTDLSDNTILNETQSQDSLIEWQGKVISDYSESSEVSYAVPDKNRFYMSIPLENAIEEYGDTARYMVVVDIFEDNDVCTDLSILEAEMVRLEELGYEAYIEVNSLGTEPIYYFCIQATKEQLENFDCNENYGYFFFGRSERIPLQR